MSPDPGPAGMAVMTWSVAVAPEQAGSAISRSVR
jgi:hypothetical protein